MDTLATLEVARMVRKKRYKSGNDTERWRKVARHPSNALPAKDFFFVIKLKSQLCLTSYFIQSVLNAFIFIIKTNFQLLKNKYKYISWDTLFCHSLQIRFEMRKYLVSNLLIKITFFMVFLTGLVVISP